jgi:hypothetical protein
MLSLAIILILIIAPTFYFFYAPKPKPISRPVDVVLDVIRPISKWTALLLSELVLWIIPPTMKMG